MSGLKLKGIVNFCGVAVSPDNREWLVTQPFGNPITEGDDPATILGRLRTIATTLEDLHNNHHLLHRDISLGNLLNSPSGPCIIDWHTLEDVRKGTLVSCFPLYKT